MNMVIVFLVNPSQSFQLIVLVLSHLRGSICAHSKCANVVSSAIEKVFAPAELFVFVVNNRCVI